MAEPGRGHCKQREHAHESTHHCLPLKRGTAPLSDRWKGGQAPFSRHSADHTRRNARIPPESPGPESGAVPLFGRRKGARPPFQRPRTARPAQKRGWRVAGLGEAGLREALDGLGERTGPGLVPAPPRTAIDTPAADSRRPDPAASASPPPTSGRRRTGSRPARQTPRPRTPPCRTRLETTRPPRRECPTP